MNDTKECPFCAEMILAKARKCKHCGEFMPGFSREEIVRQALGEETGDDTVAVADMGDISEGEVGELSTQAQSEALLDEQYQIVLNWGSKGLFGKKPSLRAFNLSGRGLTYVNIKDADLQQANLSKANLSGASLSGANLSGADLRGALLFGTDLKEANLNMANLRWADLHGARLFGANLVGAILSKANLQDANLRQAELHEINLEGARYNNKTLWPEGFNPMTAGAINVDARATE